jgi:hypothetical protein
MPPIHAAPAVFLREINGAWWFVDPDAKPFVSLGLNHVEAPLMLGDHNRSRTLKRYGDDFACEDGSWNPDGEAPRKWLTRVRTDMRQWGFNTFGYHTLAPRDMLGSGLYHVQRAGAYGIEPYRRNPVRPDLFSPACAAEIERRVAQVCTLSRTDPFCLGYAFADCPPWSSPEPNQQGLHPWVAALASAPASTPGKQAWMSHLLARYDDVATVARVYGLGGQTWDEVASVDDWSTVGDPAAVQADSTGMLAQLAERWYSLHAATVRREDPHRLILGDKLLCDPSGLPDYLLPILAKYTDLLYLQWFALFDEQVATLRDLHERTERPVLLGNSGFAVQIEGQPLRTKGILVDDHLRAGQCYADYLRAAMESGFVVGWHYCGYIEGRQGVTPDYDPTLERQCGLLDPFENEHTDALAWLRVANEHAAVWHARPAAAT